MLEILKQEAVYLENFKDVDEYKGLSCQYDYLVRFCEMKYGKHETWNYIKGLFKDADSNMQSRLLTCCSERKDADTDEIRRSMLVDLACSDILGKHLIGAVVLLGDQFDNVKPRIETYKEMLSKLDRNTPEQEHAYQYVSSNIIYMDVYEKSKVGRILKYIMMQNEWDNYDLVYKFVKNNVLSMFKKEEVLDAFNRLMNHEYATKEAKQAVQKLLNESVFK